jgi:hypothetical protein
LGYFQSLKSIRGLDALSEIPKKIAKRIPPWKGKHSSSGGRMILTNTCLSSLPTYAMGFYLLPARTHGKMDSVRSKFYWRGASGNFKYHMIKWQSVCRLKDSGGLSIIYKFLMNA